MIKVQVQTNKNASNIMKAGAVYLTDSENGVVKREQQYSKEQEERNMEKHENTCKKAFIVHGHNEAKWRELQSLLRKLKVDAIELSEQTLNGKTIIEKFEYFANQCQFAFAIFTYDDIVLKDGEEYLQVRPNVIFELGWFYARLGRERVMIIEEKNDKGNVFSDLAGIYRYTFHENVSELYGEIEDVLRERT